MLETDSMEVPLIRCGRNFRGFLCMTLAFSCVLNVPNNNRQMPGSQARRRVTVTDAIRMTKLADPDYWHGGSSRGRVAQFSTDGEKFVVILRKGNLERNTNEYSMLLWRTDEVFRSANTTLLLAMSSSSNRPGIQDVKWLSDNRTILFLGENLGESQQLYAFNIATRSLRKLTDHPRNLVAYSASSSGNEIAYLAETPDESLFDESTQREGLIVTTQRPDRIIADRKGYGFGLDEQLFYKSDGTDRIKRIPVPGVIAENRIYLSPDARYLLVSVYVQEVPDKWKAYSGPFMKEAMAKAARGQHSEFQSYVLIDANSGKSRLLLDSPISIMGSDLAWAADGRSAIITNTYLPLDNSPAPEHKLRESATFAIEVDIPNGQVTKISQQDPERILKLMNWDAKTNIVAFQQAEKYTDKRGSNVAFHKSGMNWEKLPEVSLEKARPEIVLEEGMNSPPEIYSVNPKTHEKFVLLDLNPEFKDLDFAKVEEVAWKGTGGLPAKGGLYYPTDYTPGKKYPLVIQTHGWSSERFFIDGPWTTAFAAQPLAARQIMVLQVGEFDGDGNYHWWEANVNTQREVNRAVSSYEGAIDYLDQKGLIDRRRVGIIGFSRSCFFVKYALTHLIDGFAAASITDGVDFGYLQYVTNLTSNPRYGFEAEKMNGGSPFGDGLKAWIENAPGFHIEKVRTPIRITALSPAGALFEWEWFAGLTRLSKPVEMVVMQDGNHLLQKPWERMISQEGSVDWFRFWLKGEEDPDPAKAEQYKRWRELRKLQEKQGTGDRR